METQWEKMVFSQNLLQYRLTGLPCGKVNFCLLKDKLNLSIFEFFNLSKILSIMTVSIQIISQRDT